jgi:RHS repeat-associated protein
MVRSLYDGLSFDVLRENVTFTDGSFTTKFTTEAPKANEPTVSSDRYVWIGDDESAGRTTQNGNGKTRSLHYTGMQVGLYAYGQSVAMNRSASGGSGNATRGGIAYFGSDVLGSVRSATDEYGSIEGRYEYDAFGKPYKGDFTTGLNAGYTGKPYDSVTGLYNYGYRDYKPETARFTTVDPIKDGSNWYAYVNNDAVNFRDPFGLCKESDKISKLGEYGDPRYTPGISTGNSIYTTYSYTDKSALAATGKFLNSVDSQEDGYGKTGVITYPSAASGIQKFGDVTLTTFDIKSTQGLDGYIVSVTTEKEAAQQYKNTVVEDAVSTYTPTVLSEAAAKEVLSNHPELVNQALNEDRRTWVEKIRDFIF